MGLPKRRYLSREMVRHMIFDEFDPSSRYLCSIAAAVLGAGALGAAGTVGGSLVGANAQRSATNNASALQSQILRMLDQRAEPFIGAGTNQLSNLSGFLDPNSSSSPLNALMRLTMPGANMNETLAQTPGFQFTEDRGLRAVNNALAARGLGGSGGAVAKGASEYATGLASNTWQNVVNALMNTFTGGAGAMQNLVNTGTGALGALSGNAVNIGNALGSNAIGAGNATAGAATNIGSAFGNLGQSGVTAALLQRLLPGNNPSTGLYGAQPTSTANTSGATWG